MRHHRLHALDIWFGPWRRSLEYSNGWTRAVMQANVADRWIDYPGVPNSVNR